MLFAMSKISVALDTVLSLVDKQNKEKVSFMTNSRQLRKHTSQ